MFSILNTVCLNRISVYRTHADIGLSKRSKNNPTEKERFNITKTGGPRMTGKKIVRPCSLKLGCDSILQQDNIRQADDLVYTNYVAQITYL